MGRRGWPAAPLGISAALLSGSASQVEWAGRIKRQVNAEFDRVAASFRSVADNRTMPSAPERKPFIAILEEKRAEVMSRKQAGYFIHDWQEISDQVRHA